MATALKGWQVLVSAGNWKTTPDDYSSIRFLQLNADGTGELVYAYGQTIYAVVPCLWEIPAAGRLRLTYSVPTRGRLAAGFVLGDTNRVKEVSYHLSEGRVAGPGSSSRLAPIGSSPGPGAAY